MREFLRILCPVDLSEPSFRPLVYAAAIGQWYGGQVSAVYAAPASSMLAAGRGVSDPSAVLQPLGADDLVRRLHQTVSAAGVDGPNVTVVVDEGEPATAIIRMATTMQADLVVMSTHGQIPFDPLLLGSVTAKVLRGAPCPVLTVPPDAPSNPSLPVKRIVCGVDFSPSSVTSFRHAVDLGRRAGAAVVAVYAIEWLTEQDPCDMPDGAEELRQHLADDAQRQLAEIVSHQTPGRCDVTARVTFGRAYREILRIAEAEGADLVVIGTQGRGEAAVALFGSTTQQIVARASCAVLTTR